MNEGVCLEQAASEWNAFSYGHNEIVSQEWER